MWRKIVSKEWETKKTVRNKMRMISSINAKADKGKKMRKIRKSEILNIRINFYFKIVKFHNVHLDELGSFECDDRIIQNYYVNDYYVYQNFFLFYLKCYYTNYFKHE